MYVYIYIYIYIYICIYIRYQGGLGVSTHSKSSSSRVHLYYCLSDNYVSKVALVFQLIVSLHQLEYTFIIA